MPDNNASLNYPYAGWQAAQNQPNVPSCWPPITVRLDDDTVSRIADAVIAKLRPISPWAGFIEPADA